MCFMLLHVSCFPFSLLLTHHLLYLIEVAPYLPRCFTQSWKASLILFILSSPITNTMAAYMGSASLKYLTSTYFSLSCPSPKSNAPYVLSGFLQWPLHRSQCSTLALQPFVHTVYSHPYKMSTRSCSSLRETTPSGFPPSLDWDPAPAWPGLCYPRTPCSAFLPLLCSPLAFGLFLHRAELIPDSKSLLAFLNSLNTLLHELFLVPGMFFLLEFT